MTHVRRSLVVAVAASALLCSGAPALADPVVPSGPVRSVLTIPGPEIPGPVPFRPCPEAGQITQLTVERTDLSFTTRDGDLVRAVRFVSFTGVLTGTNGEEIPYSGHFRVTDDYERGVTITTGMNGRAVLPTGEITMAAGREVRDLETGVVETVAGANTFGAFTEEICAALGA